MKKSNLAIGCISDEKYICLLKPFLKSLYFYNPDVRTYITLVDCENRRNEIEKINNNIVVNIDNTKHSSKRKLLARHGLPVFDRINNPATKAIPGGFQGPRWLMSNKACYCSNIRFRVILDIMKKKYNEILFMDVDAIINKPLIDLQSIISKNDITIMKEMRGFNDPDPINAEKFAPPDKIDWHCGIIGLSNNEITRTFFEQVMRETEADMFNWDADQDQFNIAYKKYKDKIKLFNLPREFKDEGYRHGGYSDDSYIWCGAGEAKYSNKQYIDKQITWS